MKNSHYLLNRVFLSALFLLLFNDWYLKAAYPSFLSGKLSDVTGLIVLLFFLVFLFGDRFKGIVFASSALFFCWWKSSLSSTFIQSWNELFPVYGLERTIDYTDLFCLFIFIPAWFYQPKSAAALFRTPRLVVPVLLLTVFAITATSKAKRINAYSETHTYVLQKSFKIKKVSLLEFLEYLSLSNMKVEKNANAVPPEKPGDYCYYTLRNFEIIDGIITESMHIAVKEKNGNLKLLIQDVTLYGPPSETDKEVKKELLELLEDFFAIGE